MITIKVEGLQDLERRLREFGPKVAKNGLRAANFAGAQVFREAVKQTAPVRTGQLKATTFLDGIDAGNPGATKVTLYLAQFPTRFTG